MSLSNKKQNIKYVFINSTACVDFSKLGRHEEGEKKDFSTTD